MIAHIAGHLLDSGAVHSLHVSKVSHISCGDEVNRHTLTAETTGSTDSVDVFYTVGWEIVVDHKRDLLHFDTSCKEIRGDLL